MIGFWLNLYAMCMETSATCHLPEAWVQLPTFPFTKKKKGINILLTVNIPRPEVYSLALVTKFLVERGTLEGWDWAWLGVKATGLAEGRAGKVCMTLEAGYLLGDHLSYGRFQQGVPSSELRTDWEASRTHIPALGKGVKPPPPTWIWAPSPSQNAFCFSPQREGS